jgi:hypothetical protein
MNEKKYELIEDQTVKVFGKTLFRIRAVRTFGIVTEGDLGGYIESEKNLDHEGAAWVYGDARVYGAAWVYGYAQVYGAARVYGDARVYGYARVSEGEVAK